MLQRVVDGLVYSLFGLDPEKRWVGALHFFLYDSIKIFLLLFLMIAAIGFLRTYFSPEKGKEWFIRKGITGNCAAALFGAVTPFCSCSSIPIFFGFLKAGIPLGVSFSFLITSPLINEYLVVLMLGFFGWQITALYVLSGLAIGIFSGVVLGRMNLSRHLVSDFAETGIEKQSAVRKWVFQERIRFGIKEAVSIVRSLWGWMLAGIAIGSLMHNYVPQEAIHSLVQKMGWLGVPLATLLGIPLYGGCATILPMAVVLFQKGMPMGTVLALMMSVAALSFPEAVMLRRAMRLPLILIFFGVTGLAIMLTGYLFNAVALLLALSR